MKLWINRDRSGMILLKSHWLDAKQGHLSMRRMEDKWR